MDPRDVDPRTPEKARWKRETGGGIVLMDADNGFVLSPELRALRDQVGKIIREEIIPIEARCDPDAPEIPEADTWRIARKAQAAGMWCMGAPRGYGGGGRGRF